MYHKSTPAKNSEVKCPNKNYQLGDVLQVTFMPHKARVPFTCRGSTISISYEIDVGFGEISSAENETRRGGLEHIYSWLCGYN